MVKCVCAGRWRHRGCLVVRETAVIRPLRTFVLAGDALGALGTGGVYVPLGASVPA
jgi:hypothetical protein